MKRAGVVLALAAAACGHAGEGAPTSRALPAGVVARVGGRDVTAAEVQRVAAAQRIGLAQARDLVVRDTLLARGAEARNLAKAPDATLAYEGELARRVLRRELAAARATPPTEEELQKAAERRWLDVDRPAGFRTVHAVVMFKPTDDDEKKAKGRALAAAIRAAVAPIAARASTMSVAENAPPTGPRIGPQNDPDPLSGAFRQAVLAVPTGGLEVRAEPLPPISAAGRELVPGEGYVDPAYAKAAAALSERGDLSPVVESTFGAHVILLLERTPPLVLEGDARLARLRDDIVNERARAAQRKLLSDRKERSWIAPDAVGLLELVRVDGAP